MPAVKLTIEMHLKDVPKTMCVKLRNLDIPLYAGKSTKHLRKRIHKIKAIKIGEFN